MENKVKLSPPWITYFNQIQSLFSEDNDVESVFDQSTYTIKLYVDGSAKAEAIEKLLPAEKDFGNVKVKIIVYPANIAVEDKLSLIKRAFDGNSALVDIISADAYGFHMDYIIFKKKVVQFFNDDISDVNGVCSTLYQEIAKNVLGEQEGIYFCTDVNEKEDS